MKKIIMMLLAFIVVAIVTLVVVVPMLQDDGSEKPWGIADIDGTWKTELWIVFEDGNEVLADNFADETFSVTFAEPGNTQKVTSLIYKVSAKASTDGAYDTAYIDLSNIEFGRNIMLSGTTTTIYEGTGASIPLGVVNIPVDNQFHELVTYTHGLSNQNMQDAVEANPYDNGYSFGFYIDGDIKFRGSSDETWKTTDDPALAAITLVAISNEIFLDLSGEVTVIYT